MVNIAFVKNTARLEITKTSIKHLKMAVSNLLLKIASGR